jgi:hypothetical protein
MKCILLKKKQKSMNYAADITDYCSSIFRPFSNVRKFAKGSDFSNNFRIRIKFEKYKTLSISFIHKLILTGKSFTTFLDTNITHKYGKR